MTDEDKISMVINWYNKRPEFCIDEVEEMSERLSNQRSQGIPPTLNQEERKILDDLIKEFGVTP